MIATSHLVIDGSCKKFTSVISAAMFPAGRKFRQELGTNSQKRIRLLWRKLTELSPQLQPCIFERTWVVAPVAPTRGNRLEDGVHESYLPQVLENLGVFVVLNAVSNGLQTDPRSRLGRSDRTRRIEEDSVARSAQAAAASGGVDIVPTADGVPGGPSVGAIVKDARRALRPVQEPRLDALVDRGIVHHPFRSVAEAGVTAGIAPEVAATGKRQSGPLLHGIEQHPVVDGAAPITLVEEIRVGGVDGHYGLDAWIGGMGVGTHGLENRVRAGAAIQFVGDIEVQREACGEIGRCGVDLTGRREGVIGTIALDPDKIVAVQPRAIEAEIGHVGGCVRGYIIHHFVPHQSLSQGGYRIAGGGRPERPGGKFRGLRRKLKVPHRERDRDGHTTLICRDRDRARIASRRTVGGSARHGNVNPVGLILPRADAGIAGFERGPSSAQRQTRLRIIEGDERLGVSTRTKGWIAATAITRGARDGDVVFAVQREVGCRDGGTAGTGERGGEYVHVAQAAGRSLHHDLGVYGFTACAGQTDGGSRAGGVSRPDPVETRCYPNGERRWNYSIYGESSSVAGHTSSCVADCHGKLRSVVGTRCSGRGIAGRSRTTDRRAIFLPLIAQRSGARGGYAEGGCLTGRDRLACRLGGNRRSHRSRIDCERGRGACYRAGRVGYDNSKRRTTI